MQSHYFNDQRNKLDENDNPQSWLGFGQLIYHLPPLKNHIMLLKQGFDNVY